jgi:hypothetical protein
VPGMRLQAALMGHVGTVAEVSATFARPSPSCPDC